jgi:hypothetical protein
MSALEFQPDDFIETTRFYESPVPCRVCHTWHTSPHYRLTRDAIRRLFAPHQRFVTPPDSPLPSDILICGHPLHLCSRECIAILCLNPDLVMA